MLNKAKASYDQVQHVHSDVEDVSLLLDVLAFWSAQVAGQDVEAKEVNVVGSKDHQEKGGDVLGANLEEKHTKEDNDVANKHNCNFVVLSVLFSAR